jgi:hypothetical protein
MATENHSHDLTEEEQEARDKEFLTIGAYRRAHQKVWYAVLIMFGFLLLGVCVLAYTLRHESIQRANAIRSIARTNSALIKANSKLAAEGAQAHDALCKIKSNLSEKVNRTEALLEEHPEDPIFGIPREIVVDGLKTDKKQLVALENDIMNCGSLP